MRDRQSIFQLVAGAGCELRDIEMMAIALRKIITRDVFNGSTDQTNIAVKHKMVDTRVHLILVSTCDDQKYSYICKSV